WVGWPSTRRASARCRRCSGPRRAACRRDSRTCPSTTSGGWRRSWHPLTFRGSLDTRSLHQMSVKLRLTRVGKTKQPQYRVVAADSRSPRDGRFIQIVGTYNPRTDPSTLNIDADKAAHYL